MVKSTPVPGTVCFNSETEQYAELPDSGFSDSINEKCLLIRFFYFNVAFCIMFLSQLHLVQERSLNTSPVLSYPSP